MKIKKGEFVPIKISPATKAKIEEMSAISGQAQSLIIERAIALYDLKVYSKIASAIGEAAL